MKNVIDVYRNGNNLVLWQKTTKNVRKEHSFSTHIYIDAAAQNHFPAAEKTTKKTYKDKKEVLELRVPSLDRYESYVREVEKKTKHRFPLYNADIPPEQLYAYNTQLFQDNPTLTQIHLRVIPSATLKNYAVPLKYIDMNGERYGGSEPKLLRTFLSEFMMIDPDVIIMDYAYARLPYLAHRLQQYGLHVPFHRWDPVPIRYKGGKSFYSYGGVYYRTFALKLHGRLLIDRSTTIGNQCPPDAIAELSNLSSSLFQNVASRSFGAVFQAALVRNMLQNDLIIPYKEKPFDDPISFYHLLKADRSGHTLDPKVGFHQNVAELDFSSMYQWIMVNKNVSAETLTSRLQPREKVPGLPFTISHAERGLVPRAVYPFLKRRMEYKKNPAFKQRAAGLKWVLVSSNGYLRFREFKLGVPSSHMSVCAYARETLLQAMHHAEQRQYKIVHGIIDSLYVKKKGMDDESIEKLRAEIEQLTGIPLTFEGKFKWIGFLPSINDSERPVPARYYGVFTDGSIKARGIEVRQRNTPLVVKNFQQQCLNTMARFTTKKELVDVIPQLCRLLHQTLHDLQNSTIDQLTVRITVSKESYTHNIPQKKITQILKSRRIPLMPGQVIYFIYQKNKVVLPEDYNGKPDVQQYKRMFVRALFVLVQPFGVSRNDILEQSSCERQTKVDDYHFVPTYCFPVPSGKQRKGLSEAYHKKRLEYYGWTVWRGGSIGNYRRKVVWPNVYKKYLLLTKLLYKQHPQHVETLFLFCAVHHGMPDFICYRNGKFKFVECKLGYETVSGRQFVCITKLHNMGFDVEVHRLVFPHTGTRRSMVNLHTRQKIVLERQKTLRTKFPAPLSIHP